MKMLWSGCLFVTFGLVASTTLNQAPAEKIDLRLLKEGSPNDFACVLVQLEHSENRRRMVQDAKAHAAKGGDPAEVVYDHLRKDASLTQPFVIEQIQNLDCLVTDIRPLWITNSLVVDTTQSCAHEIANLPGVLSLSKVVEEEVVGNNPQEFEFWPAPDRKLKHEMENRRNLQVGEPEPHLNWNNISGVWPDFGVTGRGVTIGIVDTGVNYKHVALEPNYRGSMGDGTYDHDYNWLDPYNFTSEPNDKFNHGTHVTGTAVGGYDRTIGAAPGAKFISCKGISPNGLGTLEGYIRCFQFMLAPTKTNGEDPRPDKRVKIVSGSFGCSTCRITDLQAVTETLVAAGILAVFAATNSGPNCATIQQPPGIYEASFTIGAQNIQTDIIAPFSSRGPITVDGSNRLKPDMVTTGVQVISSFGDNEYREASGTSMATPLVAGTAALILETCPYLWNDIKRLQDVLKFTSTPVSTQTCTSGPQSSPNNVYGYGGMNSYTSIERCLSCQPQQDSTDEFLTFFLKEEDEQGKTCESVALDDDNALGELAGFYCEQVEGFDVSCPETCGSCDASIDALCRDDTQALFPSYFLEEGSCDDLASYLDPTPSQGRRAKKDKKGKRKGKKNQEETDAGGCSVPETKMACPQTCQVAVSPAECIDSWVTSECEGSNRDCERG